MAKGIIYLMTTAVPGLIKIGRTATLNYSKRMYNLESNGYRNVASMKRTFAIEVSNYEEKEALLSKIFEKSRVADTELFALDVNVVIQLLSSFDGNVIYPVSESKEKIFEEATYNRTGAIVPDGVYTLNKKKKSDNKVVSTRVKVINGIWTLLKGSILGVKEDAGVGQKSKEFRENLPMDSNGLLLEDFTLGECSPSFAGCVVMNSSSDGWVDWKCIDGKPIDIFRKKLDEE